MDERQPLLVLLRQLFQVAQSWCRVEGRMQINYSLSNGSARVEHRTYAEAGVAG